MSAKHLVIVDDESAVCWALERAFAQAGYRVSVASYFEQAEALLERDAADAMLLDIRLPGIDGLAGLSRLRNLWPKLPVIVMTAHGTLETAVRAVQDGAYDYLSKPFDLHRAIAIVERATTAVAAAVAATVPDVQDDALIGHAPSMQDVFKRIALAARAPSTVLITGESGTGKELVARAIHRHGPNAEGPLIPVNLSAINENVIESELFGHVRGAFTGATETRPGMIALAEGGTLFLDEIGDIPPYFQTKLLRFLEHGEYAPVGGRAPVRAQLRIVAATHRDLAARVQEGLFREDLYYRLNIFAIHLPPLRERMGDLPALSAALLQRISSKPTALPEATLEWLSGYAWPGNVRELRNCLESAWILARGGPLLPDHFPPLFGSAPVALGPRAVDWLERWLAPRLQAGDAEGLYDQLLAEIEPPLIEAVLRHTRGNRVEAARCLGLHRATLRKKMLGYAPGAAEDDEPDPR